MNRRQSFNKKRKITDSPPTHQEVQELLGKIRYSGNPFHKKVPGDFNLSPPAQPRPNKTLCDGAGINSHREATKWLREGIKNGLVSKLKVAEFPKYIWAVTNENVVLEAQCDPNGDYHGYPLHESDPFREAVLGRWPL